MSDPRERQIAHGLNHEQSTHDTIVSNAAASLAIRLSQKYLFPDSGASSSAASSSSSSKSSKSSKTPPMSLSAVGHAAAQARMKNIRERYDSRKETSLLTDAAKSWLANTLSPRSLHPELDKVTLIHAENGSELSKEWYLPLPEVYAIVLSALIDTDEHVWPVPPGSTPKKERGLRLQEFDRINNALATAQPAICTTGIRHSWLMALNGFEGKRLPLNADDLLFRGLFDFMAQKVLGEQMRIALPDGRDPVGEERQEFNKRFQSLFLTWIFEGMPSVVEEAITAAGCSEGAQRFVLSRFHDIETRPNKDMLTNITKYCSLEGLKTIPCNFTPLLAALNHPTLQNAALRMDTTPVTGIELLARELLTWLRGPDFLPDALAATDAETNNAFAKVYLLIRLLDALHQYQTHKSLLAIGDIPAEDLLAWNNSITFLARCLENPAPSLQELLSDVEALERNLLSFEQGFSKRRNTAFHDFISNYFANWFAAAQVNDITGLANLFTKLYELFLRENARTQEVLPTIRISDRMLTKWTGRINDDGILDITPYQINRILLHALCYSQDTWTEAFRMNLHILLQFLRSRFNQAQDTSAQTLARDSYPNALLDHVENRAHGVAPDLVPPLLSPGNIIPAASLHIAQLLAVSKDTPEAVIQAVVEHPNFNPDAANDDRLTPFYLAAEYGNIPFAAALLARSANCLAQFNGLFTLYTELHNGHRSLLRGCLISALPEDKRMAVMQANYKVGLTVLFDEARNPESLRLLLTSLPEPQRAAAVMAKGEHGQTLLHRAADNPESLSLLLTYLPEAKRAETVMAQDAFGLTVLHHAASNPESLSILQACLPEGTLAAAVMMNTICHYSVLHHAESNPEFLRNILAFLPEASRAMAAMVRDSLFGNTVLHKAARNPESLRLLLACIPEDERAAAVMAKNKQSETALHAAASNPESLRLLLACLLEDERAAVVKVKNVNDETMLHAAASNPESLKLLLACLPEGERAAAVMVKNISNSTVLHAAASNPESLKLLLACLSEDERAATVMTKNIDNRTVLHDAASNPESLRLLLACLPEGERAAAVETKNGHAQTVLYEAAGYPESLKLLKACVRAKSTSASSSPSFFSHDQSSKPSSSEQVTLDTETSPKGRDINC